MKELINRIAVIPAYTIQKALGKVGLTIDDMDLIEIDEAYAAVPLVSTKILADADEKNGRRSAIIQTSTAGPSPSAIRSGQAPAGLP
ncbi:MAG: hypothetical protein V1766_09965 [Pseudomonadota bacterium]